MKCLFTTMLTGTNFTKGKPESSSWEKNYYMESRISQILNIDNYVYEGVINENRIKESVSYCPLK